MILNWHSSEGDLEQSVEVEGTYEECIAVVSYFAGEADCE